MRTAETQKVCTVFLVDVSDSVPPEAVADARKAVERAHEARGEEDLVKLVTFARRPRLVDLEEKDDELIIPEVGDLRHQAPKDAKSSLEKPSAGTDLQGALQLAYGLFPPGYLKRAVLITDGVETDGDLLAEANRARGFQVKLFAIPYRRPPPGEMAVREIQAPDKVKIGESFEIIASVYSSRKNQARARLYQGEALNGLDGIREIELEPGENEIKWRSVVHMGGEVTYAFGAIIGAVINFLAVAVVVYFVFVYPMNRIKQRAAARAHVEPETPEEPALPTEQQLLVQIRDLLEKQNTK